MDAKGTIMLKRQVFNEIDDDMKKVEEYLFNMLHNSYEGFESSYRYLLKSGGKRIRPAFTLLAARYGKEDIDRIVPLAAALELVHMASLIHDDVVDASDMRRGRPTIRKLCGNDFSLHLGAYLFARALSVIAEYQDEQLNTILSLAGIKMCSGEIGQLSEAYSFKTGLHQYFYNIKRKTASLVTGSCQAGAVVSGAKPQIIQALIKYGHNIGMAYQITDDVLDFSKDEKIIGKPVGNDLQQGITTLPVIYVLKYGSEAAQKEILEILEKKTFETHEVKRISEIVADTGAIAFSMSIVNKYVERAIKAAENLPDIRTTQILKEIARSINGREY